MRLKKLTKCVYIYRRYRHQPVKIKKATYGQIVKVVVHFCHLSRLQLKGENTEKQKALNLNVTLRFMITAVLMHIKERRLFTVTAVGYIHIGIHTHRYLILFLMPPNILLRMFVFQSQQDTSQAPANIVLSHITIESCNCLKFKH